MTRFLVTGSAGFIGYHLTRRLLDEGHEVLGYDAMTAYYDSALKEARHQRLAVFARYRLERGQLEDGARLRSVAEAFAPAVIIHLAAQAGVRYSIEAPDSYVQSNLVGSAALLEVARAVRPAHLMMASTSSVYGASPVAPFAEDQRTDEPLSLYAATKKGMEGMAHSYAHLFGIPVTLFRFFTVYGPWGRPDMALFKFVDAILEGRAIDVYGRGEMQRDFTYVDDLVEAIRRLVDLPPTRRGALAQAPCRVVNIGGGNPTGLMPFIRTIERRLGRTAQLNMLDMQPGDVPRTWADPSRLTGLVGRLPVTDLEAGVAAFVEWYADWRRERADATRVGVAPDLAIPL